MIQSYKIDSLKMDIKNLSKKTLDFTIKRVAEIMGIFLIIASVLLFIALFSSCSSVRVVYDYDSTIDFNNYSTFAFSKQEIEKLEISDIDKKRILNSIEQSMKEKGYDFSSSPDLIINISTKSREDIYINQSYNRFGFGWYGFPYEQTYRPNSRIIGLLYFMLYIFAVF